MCSNLSKFPLTFKSAPLKLAGTNITYFNNDQSAAADTAETSILLHLNESVHCTLKSKKTWYDKNLSLFLPHVPFFVCVSLQLH